MITLPIHFAPATADRVGAVLFHYPSLYGVIEPPEDRLEQIRSRSDKRARIDGAENGLILFLYLIGRTCHVFGLSPL